MTADLEAAYAEWFVWAQRNLASDAAVCHAAAAAAAGVEERGGSREQAIAAARASLTSGAHLDPPGPSQMRRRTYAEWFDWARRDLGGVREQQHAAARAALAALESGAGADAAVRAGRAAAGLEPAPGPPPPPPPPPPAPGAPPEIATRPWTGYAGFWRRLGAYVVDYVVLVAALSLALVIAGVFVGVTLGIEGRPAPSNPNWLQIPVEIVSVATAWAYYTLLESSGWQGTVGKRLFRIRVTDERGLRISWARANGRYFAKVLSGLPCGLGYLWVAFSPRRQGWHDMLARTLVVRD